MKYLALPVKRYWVTPREDTPWETIYVRADAIVAVGPRDGVSQIILAHHAGEFLVNMPPADLLTLIQ